MTQEFNGLNEEEYGQLKEAVSLITVLMAGADGDIDQKEKDWAAKVTQIRSYSLPDGLKDFYQDVGEDFDESLKAAIGRYEGDTSQRNEAIANELAKLNEIFPKIENRIAASRLYESLVSFAEHVAKASGGFLSWGKINADEKRLLGLTMIDPVEEHS